MMLWVKAFHLIAAVCWFAGLFYLPRLFVYHAMSEDSTSQVRFQTMERKLYKGIMIPAMIVTLLLGLWLLSYNPVGYEHSGWLHLKLGLVALLLVYHHLCGWYLKQFAGDNNSRSATFYRWFNEVPTLLLLGIVILAVVKPF